MERMTAAEFRKFTDKPQQKPKQMKNRIKGGTNRANGNYFESIIEQSCISYYLQGRAHIEKTPEPMRPISKQQRDGSFTAVFEKKAQADYKGTLKGGRAVAFEAKHTDTDRIQQSVVSSEQEKFLDKEEQMGAICFVLVSFGFRDFFRIPWKEWKRMKEKYGRKYLKPEDIEQFRIKFCGQLKFLDD